MSYIGNAKTPLLLASNVRDDLIPDGSKTVFELSQEVPGGEAINVCVIRRRWLLDTLVENTDLVEFSQLNSTQSQIVITDSYLAAAFSIVSEDGDNISVTLPGGEESHALKVSAVSYTRDSITITLAGTVTSAAYASLGTTIQSIKRKYYGPWEILDPDTQYEIVSTSGFTNRKIYIKDLTPQINDVLYVLHRGEGTYNFVPSPYSVGPEQLSLNLRNFAVDSQSYTTTGTKTLALSQTSPTASSLIVTVNGVVQVSTNENASAGTWTLEDIVGTSQNITLDSSLFTSASSSNPVSVRVLHLTFSTVSRRAAFAPSQEPTYIAPGVVGSSELAQDSVSTEKVKDNAITGSKIRLLKTESLRFQISPTTESSIISLDQTTGDTQLKSTGAVQLKSSARTVTLTDTDISSDSTNSVSLGTASKKFKDLHLSGTANIADITVTNIQVAGDITINGTVDGTDVSVLRSDVTTLQAKVNDIISFLIPIGTIVPTARVSPLVSSYGEWLPCDGRTVSRTQYAELFNALGGASLASSWPWGLCNDSVFAIPDLQRRVTIGKSSADTLGSNEGESTPANRALLHTHTGPEHTHTLAHTHEVPGHKHTVVSSASGSISIQTASGDHTTSISHSHNQGTIETNTTSLDHTHRLTHGHSSNTENNIGGRHGHSGSTNSNSGHNHSLSSTLRVEGAKFSSSTTGGYSDFARAAGIGSPISISTESTHSHNVSVAESDITHYHAFTIPSQTDETAGARKNGAANDLSHKHSLIILSSSLDKTNSDSTGEHVHSSNSFGGFIGTSANVPEGNNNLTTISQSTATTSNANYIAVDGSINKTGAATLPHLIVNYFIRVA